MIKATAKIIPLIIFYLFFAFPNDFLEVSLTPLGRFIAILLILFYTTINTYYGIIMCSVVIFYYSLKSVEITSTNSCILLNTEPFVSESSNIVQENLDKFRKEHCENNQLKYKGNVVHNENAQHIFPDLKFLSEPCNPCDKNCGFTIDQRIKVEENLNYPKMSSDWVLPIWNTWFSENDQPPIAFNNVFSNIYSTINNALS